MWYYPSRSLPQIGLSVLRKLQGVFLETSRGFNPLNSRHHAAVVNDLELFGCTFVLCALVAPVVSLV